MTAAERMTPGTLALWGAFVSLNTLTQLAFKAAGDTLDNIELGPQFIEAATEQPAVGLALLGYISVFAVWIAILKTAPLSRAFLLTALVYVPVTIGAWAWFGESLSGARIAGIGLIVAGVAMLGMEPTAPSREGEHSTTGGPLHGD